MLPKVSVWMEEQGFTSDEEITRLMTRMSRSTLDEVRRDLESMLRPAADEGGEQNSIFDFVASSSFRGERCCAHPDCRMKKAPKVFSFSALYAEHLYLPLDLGSRQDDYQLLTGSLRMLHFNRPLVDYGIIRPSSGGVHLCKQHRDEFFSKAGEIQTAAQQLAHLHVNEFRVTVYPAHSPGFNTVAIDGPREFVETSFSYAAYKLPPELTKGLSSSRTLSPEEVLKHNLLDHVFFPSMKDLFFQRHRHGFAGATYLSDLPSEVEFLETLRIQDEVDKWKLAVLQNLTHSIPLFHDLPLERIFEIRHREEQAFRNYRNAISKAIRLTPVGNDPERAARTIWEDQIRPEVERLESKAALIRKGFVNALATRAVPTSMLIAVGLFGSHFPSGLDSAIEVLAGCSLLRDMLPSRRGSVDEQLGAEDYYFLLRAGS